MAVKTKKKGKPSKTKAAAKKGLTAKTFSGLNEKRMKSSGGGGNRVIIKQGDTVPLQFLTSPDEFREFNQHQWQEDGTWNYIPCAGDECPMCDDESEQMSKKHYKFAANVYNLKEKKVQILEGPKTLATQIFYRYKRKPASFKKRVYDITKFPTQPVTYNFELAEEAPVRVAGLKLFDLDEHIQNALDAYMSGGISEAVASSKKKGKSALDDDDEFEDEDDFEEEEDDEEDDEEEDDYDDEDDDEEDDDPDEDEMLDRDAWAWSDLKAYAKEVGVKKETKNREELVRWIIKKRGF